jgi:predicted HicB family RNase H-like nuclease
MKNVNVRIPDELHARIKNAADTDRRSLNAEILWLIEQGLERQPDSSSGHE